MARGAKRTLDEVANKSDSDDKDYSDHAKYSRSTARKSKAGPKKKSRPAPKKRRRRDSDDGITSDEEDLSEDFDFEEAEEDSEDAEVERNVRGTARRRTTQSHRPHYEEPDSDEELVNEAGEEETRASPPRKSAVIKLKLPPNYLAYSKRVTRHTRDASEDIYALTNSGRHMQTVERGTRSPENTPTHRAARVGRMANAAKRTIIDEEDEDAEEDEIINETTIQGSQMEVLESDVPQVSAEGDTLPVNDRDNDPIDEEMPDDEDVVPESENGDHKNVHSEHTDELPATQQQDGISLQQSLEGNAEQEGETQEDSQLRRPSRKQPPRSSQRKSKDEESDFEPEEEPSNDEEEDSDSDSRASPRKKIQAREEAEDSSASRRPGLRQRPARAREPTEEADEIADELDDLTSGRFRRRAKQAVVYEKPRRNRKDVDYRIIRPEILQPTEDSDNEVTGSPSRRGRGGGGWQRTLFSTFGPFGGGGNAAILGVPGGPTATGGVDSDSSDDEGPQQPNRTGLASGGGLAATHNQSADTAQNSSGTPANLGKFNNKQALADADPLGVDMNVNFDHVGGLQGHIDQLKEMVSLPLLYPEIFQRFNITPPRGVLFHGPPGTGKTLMARALANSVSSEGRKVTFYMRKGADALSKWVGEAERQLRLLFEEARKNQPSIIFFDEIDGLAPVRSSKQEQIHASIVSTLLALMDGMDGRGQVVVIGATNRPDSVDPALRRPGRFDREFYFSLPNIEARRAILDIHTKEWDPPLPSHIKDELADMTKGYGGADLRALCTEAAINAVQRRYPQIYKSDQKLVIDPKTIDVAPKDFMLAIKKMVPSSERSTSSGATALPPNIEPLLRHPLSEIKSLLSEILPQRKKLTALEEAQYEELDDGAGFGRELLLQEFDRSRVFRPRLLLRGPHGMGQQYLAGALLHVFEGLHVQAFDLPTLLSDSTRSPEAAVIQLFTEVKRHKPSVIYIPNIHLWFQTVGPAVISTFLGLLRSVPPSDPVLLLGILESSEEEVDATLLKSMFGFSKKNLYDLSAPTHDARREFFTKIIEFVKTPPKGFPNPENRKLRQLEELEVAPPPPPKPQAVPTKEELKAQKKKDYHNLNLLKIRIQPIMDQIKRYKRFKSGVIDESQIRYLWDEEDPNIVTSDLPPDQQNTYRPYEKAYDKHGVLGLRETATGKFFYNMDIVTIEKRLSNGYYKRPTDFVADVKRLVKDSRQIGDPDRTLRSKELHTNVEVDIASLIVSEPALVAECEQIYVRELAREKEAAEREKRAQAEIEAAPLSASANMPHGDTEPGPSEPVHLGESFPTNGDDEKAVSRPLTPANQFSLSFANGDHTGHCSESNEFGSHAGGASNGTHGDGDGDIFMSNSDDQSGSKDTQGSSFGPSAQPKPPYSHTAPSQQIRRESGLSSFSQRGPMTPMAPGSQPADYINEASTTQTTSDKKSSDHLSNQTYHTQSLHVSRTEYPDLTQYPDRVSQEDHLPDTQQGDSSQPSPRPRDSLFSNADTQENSGLNGSESQSKPQPPLFDAPNMPAINASANLQSVLDEEPHEPFVLDLEVVERLHTQLTLSTSGFSVEQLEQINTSLMDYLWHKRGEWNRTFVADGLGKTYNAVLEDMQAMQEIEPISQQTKNILANLSFQ
ncbi:ATPase AAA-type core [Penicillium paradoxum]|uniref:ATPase AAA-type core n=1 Tax=Penicillium paradoxum TaxID=176176 RepID=UPI0025477E83|nr:ATPase AAA-type core [Penicillium paradoxum]KAJ5782224.1 ATPase AAA-type core [Penicillium paradoxum]